MRGALAVVAVVLLTACSGASPSPTPSETGSTPGAGSGGGGSGSTTSSGGTDATATSVPDDGSLGAKYINERKCGACHNEGGQPALSGRMTKLPGYAATVYLYAPNLTPDPETGIGSWTDGQLRLAIREGVDKDGMVLCPEMQHYKDMPDAEVDAIIAYLRKMTPVKKVITGSVCPPLKG